MTLKILLLARRCASLGMLSVSEQMPRRASSRIFSAIGRAAPCGGTATDSWQAQTQGEVPR